MSIISRMERRSPWGRFVIGLIFFFLTLGGVTILYPFALMLSGSVRSEMDETQLNLVPRYLFDDDECYRKFLEYKYNQDIESANRAHMARYFRFGAVPPVKDHNPAWTALWTDFVAEAKVPSFWYRLGGIRGVRTVPANARRYRERVADYFNDDLQRFRRETGVVADTWLGLTYPPPQWWSRQYVRPSGPLRQIYEELLAAAPLAEIDWVTLDGRFLATMVYPRYGRATTDAYNAAHPDTPLASFDDFVLPPRVPPPDQRSFRAAWIEFVQEEINPAFVVVDPEQYAVYRQFLQSEYGEIGELNLVWGTAFESFADVELPNGRRWLSGSERTDYESFLVTVPPEQLQLTGPQWAWQDWLADRFGSIDALNAHTGGTAQSWAGVRLPLAQVEYQYVMANSGRLRRQFAARNYVNVVDTLFTHGRTFTNTVVYCLLVVSLNLLINPMAAYALSRFKLKGTYKILLILMATSAFPPMVTLIPQFVILQNLNLMNTYIALLLPMLANGYLIFLLKGFFDSLPQDLYDAAMIDGASEIRVFFQITMALSKPILAVVALQAFNGAYTAFLYPLLVAPDPDMWLMSVWLYQFQEESGMSGVFASVLVASIPTIVIFLFAQNIILRGIAVPVEK